MDCVELAATAEGFAHDEADTTPSLFRILRRPILIPKRGFHPLPIVRVPVAFFPKGVEQHVDVWRNRRPSIRSQTVPMSSSVTPGCRPSPLKVGSRTATPRVDVS